MNTEVTTAPQEVNLETVVSELFGGKGTTYTLASGRIVTFQQAKFTQIATVTRLFETMVSRIPRDKFIELLVAIADAQAAAMAEGRSAADISLNTTNLVEKAFGEQSILLTIFALVMDSLPEFIPQFCDLSADDFGNLDIDEAVLVASGVVAVNYSFFTQKLLPLLKIVMRAWLNKRDDTAKK